MNICNTCKRDESQVRFYPNHKTSCIECDSEKNRIWREKKKAQKLFRKDVEENLVNHLFGKLKVIEFDSIDHNGSRWICLCECGSQKVVSYVALKYGKTVSCGCKRISKGTKAHNWKGIGEISGVLISRLKANAKRRGISFEVTPDYLWQLFQDQNRRCVFTGEELHFPISKLASGTASLDRIDSTKGYIEGNVQWVLQTVNFMKQDMSDSTFIDRCRQIATRFPEN